MAVIYTDPPNRHPGKISKTPRLTFFSMQRSRFSSPSSLRLTEVLIDVVEGFETPCKVEYEITNWAEKMRGNLEKFKDLNGCSQQTIS